MALYQTFILKIGVQNLTKFPQKGSVHCCKGKKYFKVSHAGVYVSLHTQDPKKEAMTFLLHEWHSWATMHCANSTGGTFLHVCNFHCHVSCGFHGAYSLRKDCRAYQTLYLPTAFPESQKISRSECLLKCMLTIVTHKCILLCAWSHLIHSVLPDPWPETDESWANGWHFNSQQQMSGFIHPQL